MFMKSFPKMTFYRFIKNFIDVQTFYARVYTAAPQTGLAKVTEKVFGKKLCKVEQCLNWERRPLRESQKHYGALDAHILVQLIQKLEEKSIEEGYQINKFINTLDKRLYNPVFKEEDPLFEYDEEDTADTFVVQRSSTAQLPKKNY